MKKAFLLLLVAVPMWAISYIHLDGSSTVTITPPESVTVEADFYAPGSHIEVYVYADANMNGVLDTGDNLANYFGFIDGVPTIGDCDTCIEGDDDGAVNGLLSHSFYFDESIGNPFVEEMRLFVIAKDEDASEATATMIINNTVPPPEAPPYIVGTITEEGTGTPLANVYVMAYPVYDENDTHIGLTDAFGHYVIDVPEAGIYYYIGGVLDLTGEHQSLLATDTPVDSVYVPADSVFYDASLHLFNAHITGTIISSESGLPISNVMVFAANVTTMSFSVTTTDSEGIYYLGADIGAMVYISVQSESPVTPHHRTAMVTSDILSGQNFVIVEPTCLISGAVYYSDTIPAPGIVVQAGAAGTFKATTKPDGTYNLLCAPDTMGSTTNIMIAGFSSEPSMYSPVLHDGDTLADYDFYLTMDAPHISGTVVDADDTPVDGAYVIIGANDENYESDAQYGWAYTTSGSDGSFSFDELLPTRWYVGGYLRGPSGIGSPLYIEDIAIDSSVDDLTIRLGGSAVSSKFIQPVALTLNGAYPNPFNANTNITFTTPSGGNVDMELFDQMGRRIASLIQTIEGSGKHSIDIDAVSLPTGTYLYRLRFGNKSATGKITVVK